MKVSIIIFALFCSITLQQSVLIASDPSNTVATFPAGSTVVIEPFHTFMVGNFLANGAQWIWISGGTPLPQSSPSAPSGYLWPVGFNATFSANFIVTCQHVPHTLKITADSNFTATIGGYTFTGGNSGMKFQFPGILLLCGLNTININVLTTSRVQPPTLIFSIEQDQTWCQVCQGDLTFFNRSTCTCQCNSGCRNCTAFNTLYSWNDYPTCGCKCAKVLQCTSPQFFNKKSCNCECLPTNCAPGYYQDKKTCKCTKSLCNIVQICTLPTAWDNSACKCV